jgi:two-component system, NarL family, response regulator NreC
VLTVRIILADDHTMFRRSLAQLLDREGFEIIAEASDGMETVNLASKLDPDAVVLDMNMPHLNGVEVAREITRQGLRAKTVILTMFEDDISVREALRAGATGYVLKTQAPTDLVQALRELAEGNRYLSPGITNSVVDACLRRSDDDEEAADALTSRERQILQLVAEGNATKEIARLLNLTIKTVESHRSRLMRKLDTGNIAGLVRHAVRQGIIRP